MNKLSRGLCAAAILLTPPLAQSENAAPAGDPRGRFEGVAASATAVWVIDTRTGRVRKCTQEFADQAPVCSDMSN